MSFMKTADILFTRCMDMEIKRYSGLIFLVPLACLAGLRILFVARSTEFVDFRAYYDTTWAMLRGGNPFILSNLRVWNWAEAPICYPGAAPVFLPFMGFGIDTAKYVFLALNILAGISLMLMVMSRFGFWENTRGQMEKLRSGKTLPLILLMLFLSSAPFIACLRHGQIGGSARLPSTEGIASLRQTRKLRRQTGNQRRPGRGRANRRWFIGWFPSSL